KNENNNTTAVVEYPLQDDDLTHPGLYRYKINTMPHYPYHSRPTRTTKKLKEDEDCDWDLYPTIMREIENH
ncbi:hypothetical protein BDF20DRAFT_806501, partial [Mycotypha africana]|uniref:uncharacterized protein n=1 Tax=Mycotypha africana TaxID=64632 RepID=UPI0023012931